MDQIGIVNRTINIPPSLEDVVVQGDSNSKILTFKIQRYFDGADLSQKNIQILYVNAAGESNKSQAILEIVEENSFTFSWLLPASVAIKDGTVLIAVEFTDEGNFIWRTKPTSFNVSPSFIVEGNTTEPDYTILKRFVSTHDNDATSVLADQDEPFYISNRSILMTPVDDVAVNGDNNSQILSFTMPRFFDNIDLADKVISIKYINANNQSDRTHVVNVNITEDTLTFGWLLDGKVTAKDGIVKFAIEFLGYDENGDFFVWQTTPAQFSIAKGLYVDGEIEKPDSSWMQEWLLQKDDVMRTVIKLNNIEMKVKRVSTEVDPTLEVENTNEKLSLTFGVPLTPKSDDDGNALNANALGGRPASDYIVQEVFNHGLRKADISATATYSLEDKAFVLSDLPEDLPTICTIRFKAPVDYTEGDAFIIGNTVLQARLVNMEEVPNKLFKANAVVSVDVDLEAQLVFFKSGGGSNGLPSGWTDVRSAIALEDIGKEQPIIFKHYRGFRDGIPRPIPVLELPTDEANGCALSSDGTYLAVGVKTSPYLLLYKYNSTIDAYEQLPLPSYLPKGYVYTCAFSPNDEYLAIGCNAKPYLMIYKRNEDTFVRVSDPATVPATTVMDLCFSFEGTYLAVAYQSSPYIMIYKCDRDNDQFIKLANPSTLPTGTGLCCCFSPDDQFLVVGHSGSTPWVTIYQRNGDTFSKITNPSALPNNNINGCSFSFDGTYLSLSGSSTRLTIYKYSNNKFVMLQNITGNGMSNYFDIEDSSVVVGSYVAPYIFFYRIDPESDTILQLTTPDISLPSSMTRKFTIARKSRVFAYTSIAQPYLFVYDTAPKDYAVLFDELWNKKYYANSSTLGYSIEEAVQYQKIKVNVLPFNI